MTDAIKVFFAAPSNSFRQSLRRMGKGRCSAVSARWSFCFGVAVLGIVDAAAQPTGGHVAWPADDPRWPKACEQCGAAFGEADDRLVDYNRLYCVDDGREFILSEAPIGACWDCDWYHDYRTGPDGRSLVVRCPDGHDWFIDGRAKNCGSPSDDVHRCWVRHGRPEDGTLHVDKNGNTCSAGAGSIDTGKWHGFLHHGHLHT